MMNMMRKSDSTVIRSHLKLVSGRDILFSQ